MPWSYGMPTRPEILTSKANPVELLHALRRRWLLAVALGFTGHQQAASVFGGTTIIGLAAVFALGRVRTRDNGQGRS